MPKDLFSAQSDGYAKYRPTYPTALFEYILQFVNEKSKAWDCATGNGQAANALANYFECVEATDISQAQLSKAVQRENIYYQIASAEETPFADNSFDLITVATAYHWFNWDGFYREATRVGKPGAVVAAWCYFTCRTNDEEVNALYDHFYHNITGPFWDRERKYVDEKYETVDFHFDPLPVKEFVTELQWNKEQFKGYLSTWSAVPKYIGQHGTSPVKLIEAELDRLWPDDAIKTVYFPLCLLLGRIKK